MNLSPDVINNDGLRSSIELRLNRIEFLQSEVDAINSEIREIKAELDRRELDAFWAANPGERLEVGDNLLVTEEYRVWKRKDIPSTMMMLSVGEWITIESFDVEGDILNIYAANDSILAGSISLEIAYSMRAAYLAQYPEKAKSE